MKTIKKNSNYTDKHQPSPAKKCILPLFFDTPQKLKNALETQPAQISTPAKQPRNAQRQGKHRENTQHKRHTIFDYSKIKTYDNENFKNGNNSSANDLKQFSI